MEEIARRNARQRWEGLPADLIEKHRNATTLQDSVEVPRVGALRYELGFRTPETSRELFDEMVLRTRGASLIVGPSRGVILTRLGSRRSRTGALTTTHPRIVDNFVEPNLAG